MTHPSKSTSKPGNKSSARKSKVAAQATPPGGVLKQSQLDDISAGKLLAQFDKQKLPPPDDTKA
jgi:hypothetical protein